MRKAALVSDVRFTPAGRLEARTGLLGYIRLHYADLLVDGLTLRRTATGELRLSWPARRSRHREAHPLIRPSSDERRRLLDRVILAELLEQGWLP